MHISSVSGGPKKKILKGLYVKKIYEVLKKYRKFLKILEAVRKIYIILKN